MATALSALESGDLLELGIAADQLRQQLHPEGVVTYGLATTARNLHAACEEAAASTTKDVSLAPLAPTSRAALIAAMAEEQKIYPEVRFHDLILDSDEDADSLPALVDAGLQSIVLTFDTSEPRLSYPKVLRESQRTSLSLRAAILIGKRESLQQRVDTLAHLRELQSHTPLIDAVMIQVHHSTSPDARREDDATAVDYLKTLAVARVCLSEIPHLQSDWSVMGPKVLELALRFGADDAGCVPVRQSKAAGPAHHGGEAELRRLIRDAGFRPVERDARFRQSLLR